jgi:hypothetical protein
MEWLADNATNGYFLLAFAAFMLAGVWWIQKQIAYLIGAGVALVLLLIFWLVMRNVPTSAGHIEADLRALAKAVLAKNKDEAEKYVVNDFHYSRKNAEKWFAAIAEMIDEHKIDKIEVKDFQLKKKDGREAMVEFELSASSKGKRLWAKDCPWKLHRDGDVWQVEKVKLSKTDE